MAEFHNKDLKILFWNCRSINKRKKELHKILEDLDMFVCVESWLSDRPPSIFPALKLFEKTDLTPRQEVF